MNKSGCIIGTVAAIGMIGQAHGAAIDLDEDTRLLVFGSVELKYNQISEQDNADDSESTSDFEDNGSIFGFGAEHRFDSGLITYAQAEFEYDVLGASGDLERDKTFAGVRGDFGDVRMGAFDNIVTVALYDVIDPFETTSLGEETVSSEDRMIAYFSPYAGGFGLEVQARMRGDRTSDTDSDEIGLAGVAKYQADRWALHAGYDTRGAEEADGGVDEPTFGVAALADVTDRFNLGGRATIQQNADDSPQGDQTAFYGVRGTFDHGGGDLYGAIQQVDPDEGDSQSQFAIGANYNIERNLYLYAEYGDFDPTGAGTESIAEVGAIVEF